MTVLVPVPKNWRILIYWWRYVLLRYGRWWCADFLVGAIGPSYGWPITSRNKQAMDKLARGFHVNSENMENVTALHVSYILHILHLEQMRCMLFLVIKICLLSFSLSSTNLCCRLKDCRGNFGNVRNWPRPVQSQLRHIHAKLNSSSTALWRCVSPTLKN